MLDVHRMLSRKRDCCVSPVVVFGVANVTAVAGFPDRLDFADGNTALFNRNMPARVVLVDRNSNRHILEQEENDFVAVLCSIKSREAYDSIREPWRWVWVCLVKRYCGSACRALEKRHAVN